MADFVITNTSSDDFITGDFPGPPIVVAPGQTRTITNRQPLELEHARYIQAAKSEGRITVEVNYTQTEIDAGLTIPDGSVQAEDAQPVEAAQIAAPLLSMRVPFAAAGPGAADDVVIFAPGALPYSVRVLDALVLVSTEIGASSAELRDEAAGAGTLFGSFDTSTQGRKAATGQNASLFIDASDALKGLLLRRGDNGVAGEVLVFYRRENAPTP